MFQLAFGVSRSCFRGLKNPKEELKIPDAPNRALESDTDEEDEEPGFLAPKAPLTSRLSRLSILCRASVRARDACRKKGCWPDGKPIGRGHGQPYLAPQWAIKIADGSKKVEGRADDGVRAFFQPHAIYFSDSCRARLYSVGT